MSDTILAQMRRLYHHVVHGGTVTAEDLSRVIQAMERDNSRWLSSFDCAFAKLT